jgi:hypothetical protein
MASPAVAGTVLSDSVALRGHDEEDRAEGEGPIRNEAPFPFSSQDSGHVPSYGFILRLAFVRISPSLLSNALRYPINPPLGIYFIHRISVISNHYAILQF